MFNIVSKVLNKKQFDLLVGTMLGDGYINQRENGECRLQMTHCIAQHEYLEYKKRILEKFFVAALPTMDRGCGKYTSCQNHVFQLFFGLFYKKIRKLRNQRQVNRKILNMVSDYSLLIWYLDDGCYVDNHGSKAIRFATDRYGFSGNKAIKKWFWQKYRVLPVIQWNKIKDTYYIRFNRRDTKILMRIFEQFLDEIPQCMHYKLEKL